MFVTPPHFDFSHFAAPTRYLPPTEEIEIPPRVDLGESNSRTILPMCKLDIPEVVSKIEKPEESKGRKRSATKVISPRIHIPRRPSNPPRFMGGSVKEEKETSQSRVPVLNRNLSLRKVSKLGIIPKKSSDSKLLQKDNRLIKSTDNINAADSLSDNMTIQKELEERKVIQTKIVKDLEKKLQDYEGDEQGKEELEDRLAEQVTLLSAITVHSKILEERHYKGYMMMRVISLRKKKEEGIADSKYERFWFFLNYPTLCCYEKEDVCFFLKLYYFYSYLKN